MLFNKCISSQLQHSKGVESILAGATIRQEHQEDGRVDVYFRGVLNAPKAGEIGTLSVSADDQQWSGSQDVEIEKEGENYAEVKVSPPAMFPVPSSVSSHCSSPMMLDS